MRTFKAYQVINSKGESIGKQDYYSSLAKAKCGCRHIEWRLDPGSKIIEIEVVESDISEIQIDLSIEHIKDWNGRPRTQCHINGFKDVPNKSNKTNKDNSPEKIIFDN